MSWNNQISRNFYLNFSPNIIEIEKLLPREVEELSPLLISAVRFPLGLEQLKHEGAASTDVGASGQEVATDEGFEDAGLTTALAANDGHLRELDRGLATELREDVLQLVHNRNDRMPQRRRIQIGRRCRRRNGFFRHGDLCKLRLGSLCSAVEIQRRNFGEIVDVKTLVKF